MSHKLGVMRSWRYGLVSTDVLHRRDIPPLARYVYAILTTYANVDRTAWPTKATIASVAGVSEATVRRALEALEAAGVIVRTRRAAKSGRSLNTLITIIDEPSGEGVTQTPSPWGGGHTDPLREGHTDTHDINPKQGEGVTQSGEGVSQTPSEGVTQTPITEPLKQLHAREEVLNLRDPIPARCSHCRIEHMDGETCSDAGRRLAATRARGMAAVHAAMAGREEVPP